MAPRPTNPPAADTESPPRAAFDSQPSDLALIESHLRPWVATGRKPAAFIHEADVYTAGPAELGRMFAPAVAQDGERAWYFLTRLRLKSVHGRGKRIARTVATGRGWWHGEAKQKPVVDGLAGREVGLRQAFSFMADERGARVRTGWIMAELRLDAAQEEGTPVLCKVYRSPRRPVVPGDDTESSPPPQPPARKGEADDDESSSPAQNREAADGEISAVAAAVPAPGRNENDEGSAETSAAAPERENKAADDESSCATRKRHHAADDGGDESPDAARKRRKDDGFNSPDAIALHCPRCGCGFHVDAAAQGGGVAPAKSESETGVVLVGETGDSSRPRRDHAFHYFL